jgi:hypothetical protein
VLAAMSHNWLLLLLNVWSVGSNLWMLGLGVRGCPSQQCLLQGRKVAWLRQGASAGSWQLLQVLGMVW